MTLQLLICTYNEHIAQIPDMLLPSIEGVSYLVSWQQADGYQPCALPEQLQRSDVEVATLQGLGLSRNRNNCLAHATADVCLICDDDCRYTEQGLKAVISTFEQNPTLTLATFKSKRAHDNRHYPSKSVDLRTRNAHYSPSSVEIAFRREAVVGKVKFDERFGLGSGLFGSGEDNIFVADVLALGGDCRFFPIEIVQHDALSTWITQAAEPSQLMAQGAVMYRFYRRTMHLRAPLYAWRMRRYGVPFAHTLKHVHKGISTMRKLSKHHKK